MLRLPDLLLPEILFENMQHFRGYGTMFLLCLPSDKLI